MRVYTLSDPPPGIREISMEDQFYVAKMAVAKVLKLNGIDFPFKIEDIPDDVMDQIDQVLHEMGLQTWEAWSADMVKTKKGRASG